MITEKLKKINTENTKKLEINFLTLFEIILNYRKLFVCTCGFEIFKINRFILDFRIYELYNI